MIASSVISRSLVTHKIKVYVLFSYCLRDRKNFVGLVTSKNIAEQFKKLDNSNTYDVVLLNDNDLLNKIIKDRNEK